MFFSQTPVSVELLACAGVVEDPEWASFLLRILNELKEVPREPDRLWLRWPDQEVLCSSAVQAFTHEGLKQQIKA